MSPSKEPAKGATAGGDSSVLGRFEIDDDDIRIMSIIQDSPDITHVDISKRINKSQPAIGARVTKLQRKDLLCTQKGVNLNSPNVKEKLFVLFVDMATRDPASILEGELRACPFVLNAFKRSGTRNLTVVLAATRMEKLESIIDKHFRSNPDVSSVETSFVVDMARDLVLPVNWEFLKYEEIPCGTVCCRVVKKRGQDPDHVPA